MLPIVPADPPGDGVPDAEPEVEPIVPLRSMSVSAYMLPMPAERLAERLPDVLLPPGMLIEASHGLTHPVRVTLATSL
ncbi:MAG: hypothetical protein U0Q11_22230 [Vicinamibacterales bacterium]